MKIKDPKMQSMFNKERIRREAAKMKHLEVDVASTDLLPLFEIDR